MSETFFDELDSQSTSEQRKPFFAIDRNNDEVLLQWLKAEFAFLRKEYQQWHEEIRNNYKRYKEIQYRDQMYERRDIPDRKTQYMPQLVAPIIRDITDERIARMMEFKPAVSILPNDDEIQDKSDAKVAKKFIRHIDIQERLEYKWQKFLRMVFVAGEGYMVTRWDPTKGDIISDAPEGEMALAMGDVDEQVYSPLRWMKEKTTDEKDPDYGFLIEFEYPEKLKRQYPSKADQIKTNRTVSHYDPILMEEKADDFKCMKITFWHRKTVYLPKGFECIWNFDLILNKKDLPYDHGKLPVVEMKDNENPEEGIGRSFINSIKGMVSYVNNLLNMSIKQMSLMSWSKWFVDRDSVDKAQLNNDTGIVELAKNSREPKLAQGSPVSPQVMEWINKGLELVYNWGKSNSVVRGEPPPGVTSFVAMQYASESESRRMNLNVIKFAEAVRLKYQMILATCAQYYKKEDERTMLVLGKDNAWAVDNYDPASLWKNYSIIIQNQTALPDSKSAKTQYLLDIEARKPGFFSNEQFAEMLDLSNSEKYMDMQGAAARAAEAENELMMEGKAPPEPREFEFLITHWKSHVMAMQDLSIVTNAPENVLQLFKDHVMATEMLMADQAVKSPQFAQALMTLEQWPMLFTMPPPLPMPPAMGPQGEIGPPPPPTSSQQMIPQEQGPGMGPQFPDKQMM